jgi:hypothetical protein
MAMPPPDFGGTQVMCGTNTMLNMATNSCDIVATACQGNTMFDPMSKSCKDVQPLYGTKIFSSSFNQNWQQIYYQPMGDSGVAYYPAGTALSPTAGLLDTTPLYLAKTSGAAVGIPMGYNPTIPVTWEGGNPNSSTTTAIDHQLTLGEWKTCNGSYTFYNNPPDGKKKYFLVIDLAGCPPNSTFGVWGVYSNDNTQGKRVLSVPIGGLPQIFVAGGDGKGHWEREIDPNIWFKSGAMLNGNGHNAALGYGMIPNLTTFASATFWPGIQFSSNGQSNGNQGYCALDNGTTSTCPGQTAPNANCAWAPPSPNLKLPGTNGVDTLVAFNANAVPGGTAMPTPLSMLQPY